VSLRDQVSADWAAETVANYVVRLGWLLFAFWLASEVVAYGYWLTR